MSGSAVSLIDCMVDGMPCWSNMEIDAKINITDDIASKYVDYGAKHGGNVRFQSLPLDKHKFLRFDPMYQNGYVFIDEINLEFAESRRSTSNVNLFFMRAGQQLRKHNLSIIYSVIHEMWIDPRLRELTDIFVKCRDTALSPEGLASHKILGKEIEWNIYPMTRIFNGISYYDNQQPVGPALFYARPFWDVFPTRMIQAEGQTKYSVRIDEDIVEADMSITESPVVEDIRKHWGWLIDIGKNMMASGEKYIHQDDVYNLDIVREKQITKNEFSKQLRILCKIPTPINKYNDGRIIRVYEMPDEILKP